MYPAASVSGWYFSHSDSKYFGVGKIGIIDDDKVDITNLQRQVIHSTAAVGSLKVESAANRIRELNPEIDKD